MSPLSPARRAEAWDITEDDFWRKNAEQRQQQFSHVSQRWNHNRSSAISSLQCLEADARAFRVTEERLSRELMAIRSQVNLVSEKYNQEVQRLHSIDAQHQMDKQELVGKHEKVERKMNHWFKKERSQDGIHDRQWALPELIDKRPPERQLKLPPLANLHLPREPPKQDDRIVAIIDADGKILDKLQYLGLSNERTTTISARAVLQPIKLRSANRFHEDTRPSIYSFADGKGTGWIACMIQATGVSQKKKCQGCSQKESPFEGCVAVGGHLFPKCGNCEWNGTSCPGLEPLSPSNMLVRGSASLAPLRIRSQSLTSGPSSEYPGHTPSSELEALAAAAQEASLKAYTSHCNPPGIPVSGFKAVNQAPMYDTGRLGPGSALPLPTSSTAGYRRCSKASASSCPTSRQMTPLSFRPIEFAPPKSDEITKESLVLRHNGSFYTFPKCIDGVPVEKISPSHPYWEPKWPDLRTLVEPVLRSWEEKYQSAEEATRRGEAVGNVKYQYGRQVNRGNRILNFLEQGAISPYQLLSKSFMSVGKGSITSYDTLFRLCETVEALANYKTDVEPVDWLRQRLHELILAQGTAFNFSKTIHDFYNDPKLASLRQKSGFKSIGRPSGIKMPRRRAGSADEAMSSAPRARKRRKSPHSYGTASPPADLISEASIADGEADDGPAGKKQKAAAKVLDSLETGEVSDADSWSGAPIAGYDFRIYQIKTRLFTSSEKVTQYWGWVPENNMFEHQVLEGTDPTAWSVHREPIDFSLRLEDVVKISWNLKALRVYLVMSDRQICFEDDKPRGDVMVSFKRANTMRRFIKFCRQEEIELVEETWKKMEHLWGTMQSERLPADILYKPHYTSILFTIPKTYLNTAKMYSAELVYIAPYLMSAEKRREVKRINSAASSRKNSVVDATSASSSAVPSTAPSRAASPAPKKEKKKHDPLRSAVKMSLNSRIL
ncbi:hypothetical protein CCM_08063 [Cordyceps militaris CM01]|uniref:Uncharacterized protein n=1 Tax=Cordyceps militaris (strain CM01) TaxID=983644 RepID=G3JPK0_CORMM|nr:uncharacterized protein CCM_08063 [Cordyceps militaris CM01]EGX89810.1 hypothetical protein CCM_08063 [Cordyceps militaris CM01]